MGLVCILCFAQGHENVISSPLEGTSRTGVRPEAATYILGPEDMLTVRVLNVDELGIAPYSIDLRGNIELPRIGRVHAAGLTIDQLESELVSRYHEYLRHPIVHVSIAEFHSQPVSILGEVGAPGVHQIRGRRTLLEILSEAGGLKTEAGSTIEITRKRAWGPVPLPNNSLDGSGDFYTAHVKIRSLIAGEKPKENIWVMPNDVITVPRADLVYVVGAVKRSGGFVLAERSDISILEALSLAEGLEKTAGPSKAKILRSDPSGTRREIAVNIKKLLAGKATDVPLIADDILFIPTNTTKVISLRTIDAIVTTGSGLAIYHPF